MSAPAGSMRPSHLIPGLEPADPTAASAERLARLRKRFPDQLEAGDEVGGAHGAGRGAHGATP